jgi:hypothetical protein
MPMEAAGADNNLEKRELARVASCNPGTELALAAGAARRG